MQILYATFSIVCYIRCIERLGSWVHCSPQIYGRGQIAKNLAQLHPSLSNETRSEQSRYTRILLYVA
jgi:hypothetical protein